jgi:hypothetical protein
MMRAGISRVVVEIIILVIAVALALLIFSPISGYIFGSLGRTATVGGATQIQILNARITGAAPSYTVEVDVKNLGPGTPDVSTGFQLFVDGVACTNVGWSQTTGSWAKDTTITVSGSCSLSGDGTRQHNIVLYGPGNTQAQYLYSPPPS